ncbi:MAG: thiamine pyrophosphate-dependent enzyme [Actinomycetota bacterium]
MLDRRRVVAALLADRADRLLVVSGLGAPTWDVAAVGDVDRNFPLWGAMGGAVMVGLGLAIAQPAARVLVITGDGEALMGLTSLSTAAGAGVDNLAVVVLDNERYGETGMQRTNTAHGTDLAAVAAGCGFDHVTTIETDEEVPVAVELATSTPGTAFVVAKVAADEPPQVVPPRDGPGLVARFRRSVVGAAQST